MPAATAARPTAILRDAFLLAGLLAVILGLLAMHVLAGSHGIHAQAASPAGTSSVSLSDAPVHSAHFDDAGHAGHSVAAPAPATQAPALVTPASVTIGGTEVPPSCVCQGGCAEKPTVHAGCTPSPSGGSLSAPPPGSTLLDGGYWTAVRADRQAGYAYLPGTPTPRDLSISRT